MSWWSDGLDPISSPPELQTVSLLQRLNSLFFPFLDSGQYNFGGKEGNFSLSVFKTAAG